MGGAVSGEAGRESQPCDTLHFGDGASARAPLHRDLRWLARHASVGAPRATERSAPPRAGRRTPRSPSPAGTGGLSGALPLSLPRLLLGYGTRQWHTPRDRGSGQKISFHAGAHRRGLPYCALLTLLTHPGAIPHSA